MRNQAKAALASFFPIFQSSIIPIFRFLQPCLCLCRALVQITRMTPLRRMILQFSHSFLTDARTFIIICSAFPQRCALPTNRRATFPTSLFRPAPAGGSSIGLFRSQTPVPGARSPIPLDTSRFAVFPLRPLQLGCHLLGPCQNLRFGFGNQHRMLEMGGQ